MDSKDLIIISHNENCGIGNYRLANHFLSAKYKNTDEKPFDDINVWKYRK
jgi:hypothetical protein